MLLPRSIALEEHFLSQTAQTSPSAKDDEIAKFPPQLVQRLIDLHGERIANMDANGVQLQVLSHTPSSLLTPQEVCAVNDELAGAIQEEPTRLRGFASLPMGDPAAAVKELKRAVHELGFVGALIDNHHDGDFFDGKAWHDFWATVAALDVPVYIHPAFPSQDMRKVLYSGGAMDEKPMAAMAVGAFGFGWHASTATTILRLLASGLFDRHKDMRIVIGHSGELLPYMFERINKSVAATFDVGRGFTEVMHHNIWITTSGMFDVHSLRLLLDVMPRDHVMFSVDYPFSDNALGKDYLERIVAAGLLQGEGLQQFAAGNAIALLYKSQDERQKISALTAQP